MTPMDISKFEIPRSKLVREIGPVFEKVSKEKRQSSIQRKFLMLTISRQIYCSNNNNNNQASAILPFHIHPSKKWVLSTLQKNVIVLKALALSVSYSIRNISLFISVVIVRKASGKSRKSH